MVSVIFLPKRKLSKHIGLMVILAIIVIPAYADQVIKATSGGTLNVGFSTDPSTPNLGDQTQFKINFLKGTAVQPHIDYKVAIMEGNNQICGTSILHTAEGSITIPCVLPDAATYRVIVEVDGILFQPIPPETAAFTVTVGSTTSSQSPPPKSGCLIATAAFGSELSPQVQFLRGFRDNHLLATESGSSFMTVFNAWYYSFSPYVADYERQQPWLQQIVKTSIYPLLGILTLSEKGFSTIQGDYGAVIAGSIASSMIGAVYFWPFALSIKQVRKNRFNYKIIAYVIGGVSVSVIGSIFAGNQYALMITTSLFVLILLSISAILVAKLITKAKQNFLNKLNKT